MSRPNPLRSARTGRLLKLLTELALTVETLKLVDGPAATAGTRLSLTLHDSTHEILSGIATTGEARTGCYVDGLTEGPQLGAGQFSGECAGSAAAGSVPAAVTS